MVQELLAQVYRQEWGRLLSLLVAGLRRIDLAEESLADAFEAAAVAWPSSGAPSSPAAWLLTVARRKALDRMKSESVHARKLPLLVIDQAISQDQPSVEQEVADLLVDPALADERLRLLLLTCHPAIAPEAQAALALRLVLGIPTLEIARLFLVSESTMAARITRAKKKIATAGIPFTMPDDGEFPGRVESVVRAVYLSFTAGYAPGQSDRLLRIELASEAIRLGRLLAGLVPQAAAPRALLAVMLLQHSRRDARTSEDGQLVLLSDQDRRRWHSAEIVEAVTMLRDVRPDTAFSAELWLQAQIAAVHATAPTAAQTDWSAIAELYAQLYALTGNPVVQLNRAVAVAESDGPAAGLALIAEIADALPRHHRLPSVRAELLRRLGDLPAAASAYREAIALCTNEIELNFLREQLATVAEG